MPKKMIVHVNYASTSNPSDNRGFIIFEDRLEEFGPGTDWECIDTILPNLVKRGIVREEDVIILTREEIYEFIEVD